MAELERMLRRLEAELDWPETPDLASTVSARLRAAAPAAPPGKPAPPTPRRPLARALRRPLAIGLRGSLALAAILTLVLAGAVMAAVPGVRHAVLDLFGLRGATVERRQTLPSPPPPRPLDLGSRT